MTTQAMTRVYYNSACPVCDAGIESHKSKMKACNIQWIDVHSHPDAVKALGVDLETVRERLHIVNDVGSISIGASALAQLWSNTPGQHYLGWIAKLPIVSQIFHITYNCFAKILYKWNRWKKHW